MAVVGRAVIEIGADSSSLPGEVERGASGPLAAVGRTLADAVGTTFKVGMAAVGAVAVAAVGTTLTRGFSRLSALDTAQARFRGLGIEGKVLDGVMGQVNDAVLGTAYGLDEAATAAAMLMTSGVQAGEELDGALSAMVATAAASGAPLSDITGIWQGMATSGKVTGKELYMLQNRGVNAAQALADHFGITAEAARDMVSDGKVSFEDLNAAMSSEMGQMAEEMGGTFEGMRANLLAGMGRLGAALLGPVFEGMKPVMGAIIEQLRVLTPLVSEAMEGVAPVISGFFENLASAIEGVDLAGIFSSISDGVSTLGSAFAPIAGLVIGALGPLLSHLPIIGRLFTGLTGPVGLVIGLFIAMWRESEVLRDAIGEVFSAFSGSSGILSSLTPIFETLAAVISTVAGVLGDLLGYAILFILPYVEQLAQMIGPVLGQALGMVQPLLAGVRMVIEAMMPAIMNLGSAVLPILVSAFQGVMTIIQGALPVIGTLAQIIGTVLVFAFQFLADFIINGVVPTIQMLMPIIETVFTFVVDFITNAITVVSTILSTIMAVITGDWSAAWEGLKQIVVDLWAMITDTFTGALDVLGSIIQTGLDFIVSIFQWLYNVIVGNSIIPDMVNAIIEWFERLGQVAVAIIEALSAAVVAVIDALAAAIIGIINALAGGWSSVWNGIRSVAITVWNAIRSGVTTAINAVRSVITTVMNAIRSVMTTVWNAIRSTITTVMNAVRSIISSVWSAISSIFSSALSGIRTGVSSAMSTIRTAFSTAMSNIRTSVSNGINNVLSTIRSLPGKIKSALGNLGSLLRNAGRDVIQGLINGITSKIGSIGSAMGSVASKIRSYLPFSPVKEGPLRAWNDGAPGKKLMDMLIGGLGAGLPAIGRMMGRIGEELNSSVEVPLTASAVNVTVPRSAPLPPAPPSPPPAAGGDTYYQVTIDPKDLTGLRTVEDFVKMINVRAGMRPR